MELSIRNKFSFDKILFYNCILERIRYIIELEIQSKNEENQIKIHSFI